MTMTRATVTPTAADLPTPVAAHLPPHAVIWDLATSAAISRCLHAVAGLGVADALDPDGADIDELATALEVDADALGRVLRALSARGVFEVDLPRVRHSEASLLLRTTHPQSMGAFAHMMGLPLSWDAMTTLPDTVRTGRAGSFELHPDGFFAYLAEHPDQHRVFDEAMTAKSHADIAFILEAWAFDGVGSVADVGGGQGHLLRAIVDRNPGVEAVLVELPDVIARAAAGHLGGVAELVAADFFTDPLPAADVYVLMEIIHDWDDHDATRILANIRRSARPGATVLIIETVLQDRPGPDPATTLDIVMLALTGGRERTPERYEAVLHAAGLELVRVIPTGGAVQIVEARVTD
jgi:C-methyltransferase